VVLPHHSRRNLDRKVFKSKTRKMIKKKEERETKREIERVWAVREIVNEVVVRKRKRERKRVLSEHQRQVPLQLE
jgi:predicted flavoprotein YhiN